MTKEKPQHIWFEPRTKEEYEKFMGFCECYELLWRRGQNPRDYLPIEGILDVMFTIGEDSTIRYCYDGECRESSRLGHKEFKIRQYTPKKLKEL